MTTTIERRALVVRHRALAPIAIGLLAFLVSAVGIGTPSIWYDEAATVSSATRTLPQLWLELGNVDAVHGLYYFFLHGLFQVFGYSPIVLRMPSALAIGAAAALVVLLGRRLGSPRFAVLAGLIFAFLPRATWAGSEGRSYALTALVAVTVTLVLVIAVRDGRRRWWILYATLAVVGCVLFVYLALILVAHAITMLIARPLGMRRWMFSIAAAGLVIVPFGLAVVGQSGQLSWLKPIGPATLGQVLRDQWFYTSDAWAWLGWAGLVVGAVLLVRRSRGFSSAVILLPALVVPTVALLAVTQLYTPIYTPRYVTMCLPFVALVLAAALDRVRSRAILAVAVALAVVLGTQQAIEQRMPDAKEFSSWSAVADYIAAQRAEHPAAAVGVLYGTVAHHPTTTTRVIEYSYPAAFAGTVDITLQTPAAETGQLWETTSPLPDSLARTTGLDTIYLVTSTARDPRPATTQALASVGWRLESTKVIGLIDVLEYTR